MAALALNKPVSKTICSRDIHIDVIKGIGIFLVVWGHTGAVFNHFVYLFHMAVFFIASGYCWKDKNVSDIKCLGCYIGKKLKGLWLPFMLSNVIFTLLNNVFIKIGFYTDDPAFLDISTHPTDRLAVWMTPSQIADKCIDRFLFIGQPQIGGVTWFLRTLFIVSVFYGIIRYIEIKCFKRQYLSIISFIISAAGTAWVCLTKAVFFDALQNSFCAFWVFYIGILIKKYDIMGKIFKEANKFKTAAVFAAALIFLNLIGKYGSIDVSAGAVTNLPFFTAVSLLGWILLWSMAEIPPYKVNCVLRYLGRHSLSIVIFHISAFRVVSLLYVNITGSNPLLTASNPYINGVGAFWTAAYIAAGIVLPLILSYLYYKFKSIILGSIMK